MLWLVLLMFFGENRHVEGDCTSNTHWMSRIKSKTNGTFACRDCYCEDPLGWICVKKQGGCKPDIGPPEYFCKVANSVYSSPLEKGCLVCECKGKGKAWSCKETSHPCKSHKMEGKLLKAPVQQQNSTQPASSAVETIAGATTAGVAPSGETQINTLVPPHLFKKRRFHRKRFSVEI